jgi:O-antigen/teichoic acid export membrane protein
LVFQATAALLVFALMYARRVRLESFAEIADVIQLGRQIVGGSYKYLFGYFVVLAVFSQMDIFLLKWLSTDKELATYGSAFRYYTIALLALNSIQTVLLPMIQRAQTADDIYALYKKHLQLLILLIPGLIVGAWASQWIIPFVDQGKYPAAVLTFQILGSSAAISLLFSPHSSLVFRFEDFKFLFALILVGLLVLVALNIILIPPYGSIGAAIATLVGFGAVNTGIFVRAEQHRKTMGISR